MSDYHDSGSDPSGPAAHGRRELDLFDLIAIVWTQKLLIILIFLALFIPGALAAYALLTPSYEAHSRLLVLLDEDNPTPGAAGSGGAFVLDQVLQSEIQILDSDAVRRRALERRGAPVSPGAIRTLRSGFSVTRAPNASVITASYEADDPEVAANVLNAIVDAYLAYRQEVLIGDGAGQLRARLTRAEIVAEAASTELRAFLNAHGLADFEAERAAVVERITTLQTRLLAAEADAGAARAGMEAIAARLREIPQSIEHYVENDVTGQLLALEVRRRDLLASYLPDAPPVVAIEREIAALREFVQAGGANGAGQRRTGANPVYQELDAARLQQAAAAASQTRLASMLSAQLADARAEADRLRALAPAYDRLRREAEAAETAAERLSAQSANAVAQASGSPDAADSVRIVERAEPPAEAKSMRKMGVLAAGVLALGVAGLIALLRGYFVNWREPGPRRAGLPRSPDPGGQPARSATRHRKAPAREPLPVLARVGQRSTSAHH